ncbi:kinetochore protein nuf2 [Dothidotthia symphoricarpi CBS 119687]|uniref:Probable kinetochore protein NUF2 n=1 Tax=Dothidotthia symphoricarpi CBS 119687 TaxID=1392245 RepID=A0A6A6ACR9_9PLEO|nr:kinetochore protein nuf2 [Dothidotthia symphoricarpi CBS 119687]KAF2129570.1 kinetochore protein nuf2 [Dothidotthia symphoricarpi CBS 119687]
MSYNPRMSTMRTTSHNQRPPAAVEQDTFMNLPDAEIAGCITDIGINFSVADLQKPNPQIIQKVFEWLAELLMNTTREVVAPAMRAAAEDLCGDDAERLYTSDTRDLMAFFVILRKLLRECGIHDFTFNDLYKPTHGRLIKILSYMINFIRFRESQTEVIDEHFNKAERTKLRIEQLYDDKQAKEQQLADLERNRAATQRLMQEKEKRNNELKNRLLELKRGQEAVAEKLERARAEQSRLKELLQHKVENKENVQREVLKLRPYTQQSPTALEDSLRDSNDRLGADKTQIDSLDRRARALQTSTDSFGVVASDVTSCTRLLTDVQADLTKEEEELSKAARHRDALADRSNNVRDVERQERLLQKQLGNVNARTGKLKNKADEEAERARQRMEELKDTHSKLAEERGEKGREMERRRVRIEQTEKKMAELKDNIENEVHAAHDEYLKMESHIKLYITEMEQSI